MMDLRTTRIPRQTGAGCPRCGSDIGERVRTVYGWRGLCRCPDIRWTWVRGDNYVQAERR